MMLKCYMLIGCPGSGKSTTAKAILKSDRNCRIVSSDRDLQSLDPQTYGYG